MESEVLKIAEALILRDSLGLYMAKLREHEGHPNFQVTMQFVVILYKRYAKIAATKCQTDEAGRITVRRNLRSDFDLN
jgi:DNA-binding transcriptional regulator/RsmH inhibitor MraZ